ncbi:MAG TPA: c-type cytochrome [bacterium]|nr:c-type cytochrome [bacterium]
MKLFFAAVALTLLALGLGAYGFISMGWMPANADGKAPWLEQWMARKALHAAIDRQAPTGPLPIPLNDANLSAGIRLYAVNCAVCHGAADGLASNIARGLYQPAPQLARHGVEDDPEGETFWKVKHGIRLTGMPGFSASLTDDQIWRIALFLKHMDSLPPGPAKAWKAIPSAQSR